MKLDPEGIQQHLGTLFESIPDRDAPLAQDEFLTLVQDKLKVQLGKDEQTKLVDQVLGDRVDKKDDQISISDFLAWWDTFFEVETVDPFRAAVAAMEQTNVISPSSSFRAQWDLTQAVFLFYIAIMLPYRIGFDHDVVLWSMWFWLDLAIDIYFVRASCVVLTFAMFSRESLICLVANKLTIHLAGSGVHASGGRLGAQFQDSDHHAGRGVAVPKRRDRQGLP